ncbi:Phospholipid-transporting ATPase [Entamoeba marina]
MRLSGTDKQMNKFVAFVFAIVLGISVFCSMMATIMFYTHTDHWYLDFGTSSASISIKEFFSYFTLSSYLIPIACAVCLELAKTMQSLFMKWDSDFKYETPNGTKGLVVRCAAMNDELGFVEYILADKTGTLTENEMNFVECIIDDISFKANELGDSVKPKEFSSPSSSPTPSNKEKVIDFLHCMALCHNATVTDGQFKSPSPDEEALLKAAALNGVKFKHRLQASLVIEHPDEETVQLLAFFPFSSERARSSVLVKIGERIVLYSKGADHIMNSLVIDGEYCDVKPLAERGLRTLVLCKREITDEFYANWSTTWENAQGQLEGREVAMKNAIEEMEKELTVLGCTGVEDRLQPGVKETLQMFVDGGIRVWVITGDKEETGVAVGNACGLLKDCELSYINEKTSSGCLQSLGNAKNRMENNKGKHALVITASAIDICVEDCKELFKEVATEADVVMCCRSMPLQKAKIAKHVREITKKKCLAIGDGANDIPMINAASVGVGIYGKEGSQAARSADYSLYRFSHLGKLVMYHGRLSLYRNTSLIKLIFFKNAAFFLHLLWFACICMFTSQRVYDDYMMALYNFIFTSIPPVFISFFDSDLTWEQIKEYPQVNRELIRTKRGNILSYLGWFGYGTYQSIIYFYLMIMFSSNDVLTLDGKISGMVGASAIVTTYTTLGVIITFALIVKRWNGAIIFGFCVSIISFFFTYVFLTSFSGATRENLSYFAFWRALKMPGFYLYSIFAIIVAIFPCLLKIYCSRYFMPDNYELLQIYSSKKKIRLDCNLCGHTDDYMKFGD